MKTTIKMHAMIVETYRDGSAEIEVWGGGAATAHTAIRYDSRSVDPLLTVGRRVRGDGVRVGVTRHGVAHDIGSPRCTYTDAVAAAAVAAWRADAECQRRAKGGAR